MSSSRTPNTSHSPPLPACDAIGHLSKWAAFRLGGGGNEVDGGEESVRSTPTGRRSLFFPVAPVDGSHHAAGGGWRVMVPGAISERVWEAAMLWRRIE